MSSVNKVFLVGRLGQDPEARTTMTGKPILRLSLATQFSKESKTEWHRVTAFDRCAAEAPELRKGDQVCVEGHISYDNYTDDKNVKRYYTTIIAERLQLVSKAAMPDGFDDKRPRPYPSPARDEDPPF